MITAFSFCFFPPFSFTTYILIIIFVTVLTCLCSDDITVVETGPSANSLPNNSFSFTTPSRPNAITNETPVLPGGFLKSHNYSFAANSSLNFKLNFQPFHLLRFKNHGDYFLLALVPIFTPHKGKFTVLENGHVLQFSDSPPNEFPVENMVDPSKAGTHPENLALLSYFREEAPFQATLSINLREPVEPDLIESRVIFQRVSAMNGKVINKPRWYSATFKLAGQKKASLTTDFYDDVEVEEDDY